jgi:hypothetical protein
MGVTILVTPKAGAKREVLFNKPAYGLTNFVPFAF